ncbi:putative porin [Candidatus Parabeggiatoa sp. HSG14]|uniref:putative porin n=1 Tax=Candidatus Parabeggiatoa sp. HSG14 TaxID=3055593 RepID=UPI0025A754D5|nr:putative porin [Thiotrichales bacterium HSG14]
MTNEQRIMRKVVLGLISLIVVIPIGATADWTEQTKLIGDFRYRYEFIDDATQVEERHRHRIRARLGVNSHINDQVDIGLILASGNEDPQSADETLDGQFMSREITLDEAYFAWQPINHWKIKGGKFKTPFYKPVGSTLLWTGDLRPEGLILQYEGSQFFTHAGVLMLEERAADDDSFMLAGQVGYKAKLANDIQITVGTGYFDYIEIKNRGLADFDFLDQKGKSYGNTLDANGNFATDYNEWELFGDINFKVGNMPIALFADYVLNTGIDDTVDNDTGYLVGFKVGKVKEVGSWAFRYNYRRIESDAAFGLFTNSDFAGGGTDGKGHGFKVSYQIAKKWQFIVIGFINDNGLNDNSQDYNRLQADLYFWF